MDISTSDQIIIKKTLPCIEDKFAIEIVNSINVSKDHVRVQSDRLGKLSRFVDSINGAGAKRQSLVNKNLTTGLDSALAWLNVLTKELNVGFEALNKVNREITKLNESLETVVDFSIDMKNQLDDLSSELQGKCKNLNDRLTFLEAQSNADRQITLLFQKWQAHEFDQISPLQRLYSVLEQLYWGDYGEFYRVHSSDKKASKSIKDFKDQIRVSAIQCLSQDMNINKRDFLHPSQWQAHSADLSLDVIDSFRFMGDWTTPRLPVNYFASQQPDELPLFLPRAMTAEQLCVKATNERFGRMI